MQWNPSIAGTTGEWKFDLYREVVLTPGFLKKKLSCVKVHNNFTLSGMKRKTFQGAFPC